MKTLIKILLICLLSATTQAQTIQAGVHYQVVEGAPEAPETNEVYEFFGYTCPGCNVFEPHLNSFEDSNPDIKVIRVPVIFHPSWEPFAKAYYTAEAMGILDKTHSELFKALHVKKQRLTNIDDIARYLEDHLNIDKAAFLATASSFSVDSKVRKASQMAKKFRVGKTPSIVVNSKYLTSPAMMPKAQSNYIQFIEVINELIKLD